MTEVVHPKLFAQRESVRTNLHPEYMCDVLFSPSMDEPLTTKEKRMYEKVSALGGPLVPIESPHSRREQGLHRSPEVVGHSENVTNIWEQEDADKEEVREAGNDGRTLVGESRLYEAPSCSPSGSEELGSDLDRFVETEFQFLDSDDDDEGEGRRLASGVPLFGAQTNQPAEIRDQSLSLPSPLTNLYETDPEELSLQNLEAPMVTSRTSLPEESPHVDEVALPDLKAPVIPSPPPLPPAGILFSMNDKSATEPVGVGDGPKTLHGPETLNGPETMHVASKVPKSARPKNEPQSPQNDLFFELQGILNRRLKKINEDIDGSRKSDSLAAAAAASAVFAAAAVGARSVKPTPEPLNHQTLSEQTVDDENFRINSFHQEPSRTEETEVEEKMNSANSYSSRAHTEEVTSKSPVLSLEGSSADLVQDVASVEPPANDSLGFVLPSTLDCAETLVRAEESRSTDRELDGHSTADASIHAIYTPSQVQVLDSQGLAKTQANRPEIDERFGIPDDETVATSIADVGRENDPLQKPETDADNQHPVTSAAAVPDGAVAGSSPPSSVNVRDNHHLFSSRNQLDTNDVVKQHTRSSSSSSAAYDWATPSRDDWTPQMDLQHDEFESDFRQEIPGRGIHLKRREAAGQQRLHKKTPSKLYQKKPLRDQQKLANPGAFSLARINRAVKKAFGSISSKESKNRTPLSSGVFHQDDGWEIYPARLYDPLTPGEAVKVVGVETRPAYAYNAFTRQLVILPDHDRILVMDDGRRIRDQDQQRPGVKTGPSTSRKDSSASNSETGKGEKPRFSTKLKDSRQHPPNLNTKTVKSIHMHRGPDPVVADTRTTATEDAYWRRNSSPNSADDRGGDSVPSEGRRKISTLSKILSFRKPGGKPTTANGKKSTDSRMTASDMDLVKNGAVRHEHL